MSLRNRLVRLSICLLAQTAQAADPRPAELVHATRAAAQACEADADRLKQQQVAVDAELDAVKRRREALDGELAALQADERVVDAILVGDFDRAAALTHPLALQQLPKNVAAAWREKLLPLRSPGFELVRIDCDMPTQVSEPGTARLAVLRAILFVDTPKGLMLVPVHKLGILSSEAQGWKFLQLPDAEPANGAELAAIKRLLPAGLGSITVPKRPAPLMLPRLRPGGRGSGPRSPARRHDRSAVHHAFGA